MSCSPYPSRFNYLLLVLFCMSASIGLLEYAGSSSEDHERVLNQRMRKIMVERVRFVVWEMLLPIPLLWSIFGESLGRDRLMLALCITGVIGRILLLLGVITVPYLQFAGILIEYLVAGIVTFPIVVYLVDQVSDNRLLEIGNAIGMILSMRSFAYAFGYAVEIASSKFRSANPEPGHFVPAYVLELCLALGALAMFFLSRKAFIRYEPCRGAVCRIFSLYATALYKTYKTTEEKKVNKQDNDKSDTTDNSLDYTHTFLDRAVSDKFPLPYVVQVYQMQKACFVFALLIPFWSFNYTFTTMLANERYYYRSSMFSLSLPSECILMFHELLRAVCYLSVPLLFPLLRNATGISVLPLRKVFLGALIACASAIAVVIVLIHRKTVFPIELSNDEADVAIISPPGRAITLMQNRTFTFTTSIVRPVAQGIRLKYGTYNLHISKHSYEPYGLARSQVQINPGYTSHLLAFHRALNDDEEVDFDLYSFDFTTSSRETRVHIFTCHKTDKIGIRVINEQKEVEEFSNFFSNSSEVDKMDGWSFLRLRPEPYIEANRTIELWDPAHNKSQVLLTLDLRENMGAIHVIYLSLNRRDGNGEFVPAKCRRKLTLTNSTSVNATTIMTRRGTSSNLYLVMLGPLVLAAVSESLLFVFVCELAYYQSIPGLRMFFLSLGMIFGEPGLLAPYLFMRLKLEPTIQWVILSTLLFITTILIHYRAKDFEYVQQVRRAHYQNSEYNLSREHVSTSSREQQGSHEPSVSRHTDRGRMGESGEALLAGFGSRNVLPPLTNAYPANNPAILSA